MKLPEILYVQVEDQNGFSLDDHPEEMTWSEDQVNQSDVRYRRAELGGRAPVTCLECNALMGTTQVGVFLVLFRWLREVKQHIPQEIWHVDVLTCPVCGRKIVPKAYSGAKSMWVGDEAVKKVKEWVETGQLFYVALEKPDKDPRLTPTQSEALEQETRKIKIDRALLEQWADKLNCDLAWGQPDPQGFFTPTLTEREA